MTGLGRRQISSVALSGIGYGEPCKQIGQEEPKAEGPKCQTFNFHSIQLCVFCHTL